MLIVFMMAMFMVCGAKFTKRPCLIITFFSINKAFDQLPSDPDDQNQQYYSY